MGNIGNKLQDFNRPDTGSILEEFSQYNKVDQTTNKRKWEVSALC